MDLPILLHRLSRRRNLNGGNGIHVNSHPVSVHIPLLPRHAHTLLILCNRAPTTGGQYHWVSEFAPPSIQQFLSYIVGWLCVLGWQVGNTAIAFIAAQQISGLVVLNHSTYVPERWHLTLMVIALVTFCQLFNTFLARRLPLVEGVVLVLHLGGFVAILVPLWVLGERSEAREVFTTFNDGGGCEFLYNNRLKRTIWSDQRQGGISDYPVSWEC
jgi:amino acid transporter